MPNRVRQAVYVDGLYSTENLEGGNVLFTFYVRRGSQCVPVEPGLIMPGDSVPTAILKSAKQVGIRLIAEMPGVSPERTH